MPFLASVGESVFLFSTSSNSIHSFHTRSERRLTARTGMQPVSGLLRFCALQWSLSHGRDPWQRAPTGHHLALSITLWHKTHKFSLVITEGSAWDLKLWSKTANFLHASFSQASHATLKVKLSIGFTAKNLSEVRPSLR